MYFQLYLQLHLLYAKLLMLILAVIYQYTRIIVNMIVTFLFSMTYIDS